MTMPDLESTILQLARAFPYPPTPDCAPAALRHIDLRVSRRRMPRLARALLALLVIALGLLAVPPVRAAVFEVLEVGVVRILLGRPEGTTPAHPTFPPPASLLTLTGETSLEEAQASLAFRIPLPTYPPDLGAPDHVYLQDLDGDAVVLVWIDPADPSRVLYSLHVLTDESSVWKIEPAVIEIAQVNGHRAFWTSGPYLLRLVSGGLETIRLVEGRVLIWAEGDLTFRLESDLSLEEAIRMAESLR